MSVTTMQSFFDAMKELAPDYQEAVLVNAPFVKTVDAEIEPLLRGWAFLFGHTLREPVRRNPFLRLSSDEAILWVKDHLERDMVFGTVGMDELQAAKLVDILSAQMGVVQAVTSTFTISDWTFCDVLIMSNDSVTLLLAFLGED